MDTIQDKKLRLDRLRPLSQSALAALDKWYDVELTYTSNAIEGNALDRRETALVLDKGFTVSGKPLKDHYETVDLFDALQFTRQIAQNQGPITEANILDIHRIVLTKSWPEEAGHYARHPRRIAGVEHIILPAPHKIPNLMEGFCSWLAKQENTPETAFEAHYQIARMHPFADGNGRVARLLMNLVLFRGGYPPVNITPEQRVEYGRALEAADMDDARRVYKEFMTARLDESLSTYLSAAEQVIIKPMSPQP